MHMMTQIMTPEEYRSFLTASTRTAKVATTGADGRPHVVPVWFVLDGDTVVFTLGDRSAKALHMRHNPRVALCVDDETPPYAFVLIEGTVETSPNPPVMLDWCTRIARRYIGADLAEAYGKRNAVAGELLVRVTPARVIARKGIAD
jgi:PPOX class probable F420-dependent enzyme